MTDSNQYIVVGDNNRWGVSDTLIGACLTCYLPMKPNKLLHYADLVGKALRDADIANMNWQQIEEDWNDFDKDEESTVHTYYTENNININYFDPDVWERWDVDMYSGTVNFYTYKPDPDNKEAAAAARKETTFAAVWKWKEGVIVPRDAGTDQIGTPVEPGELPGLDKGLAPLTKRSSRK
tara:strand:- start:289 stop:828 length:540 start_codon:yes stop_codon:yes gene_type:complete